MEYQMIMLIGGVILVSILGWIGFRFINKKRKQSLIPLCPPEEIINQLNYASTEFERRNIESNGNSNPYEILWEISKRDRTRGASKPVIRAEQSYSGRELHTIPIRREDIQAQPIEGNKESIRQPSVSNANNRGNFFSKFKRK